VTICAVVAAYNEAAHVADVVTGASRHVSRVLVVDDGSQDETAQRARDAGAVVLRHESNRGKGEALRTGFAEVLAQPFSHVLLIDGDLQHDPGEIPKLVAKAESGAGDFVIGEREFARDAMPAGRYYTNVVGSWILSRLIGAQIGDSQSGFRLIRTDLLRQVRLTGRGYEIETEMLIKLVRAGATLDRVPVSRLEYRSSRSHIRPFRDTFRTCMLALAYCYFPNRV